MDDHLLYRLAEVCKEHNCTCAIKATFDPDYSEFGILFSPTKNYVETASFGPVSFQELEVILINPVEKIYIGKLVKDKVVDHTDEIVNTLSSLGILIKREGNNLIVAVK